MSEAVLELLKTFDGLPAAEQQQAASEILRRISEVEYPPLEEEIMAQIADETFLIYDAEEAAHDQS